MKLTLGIDFGSSASRALVLDIETGNILVTRSTSYKKGENGVITDSDPHLARQCADDYVECMTTSIKGVVEWLKNEGIDPSNILGIGVDATGSTPIPVNEQMQPLSRLADFKDNKNAYAWMWKDHTSYKEAEEITRLAAEMRPQYLDTIGGIYSSEWYWAKLLHCQRVDPELFKGSYSWVEFGDYVPALLAGIKDTNKVERNKCAAGHKGLYSETWGGFPDDEFLGKLSPELVRIKNSLPEKAKAIDQACGTLCDEWAQELGLKAGIPIAMGILDAHAGAIGSGVKKGGLVKIIGTSTCDLGIQPLDEMQGTISGVAGVASESVLPGYWGIEAGQSAVGDLFHWFVSQVLQKDGSVHGELTEKAQQQQPGEAGLLGLDWNNGNRNVLTDPQLSGLILGQSLLTKDFEIYRALIESTAFGARRIIEQMETQGVEVNEVVCCGGIPQKNKLFMQIYADVLNKQMKIVAHEETVALGAAMMGAYVALKAEGNTTSYEELQERCCKMKDVVYSPKVENAAIYNKLYALYKELHDSFGVKEHSQPLYHVMKELLKIKTETKTN
ncbi:ribulokinase [Prolixibacteraceae bacterium JC049]|nr:ribulokinase [Prolixibacteraceae bacterium JC049]